MDIRHTILDIRGVKMQSNKIKRMMWPVISIILLIISFIICRYFLFDLHGMKQLIFALFIFGLIVICIAAIFNSKITMICTAVGYMASFLMGIIFQADWIDSHGTAMNNLWIWFTLGMIAFVILGVFAEIISKVMKKN